MDTQLIAFVTVAEEQNFTRAAQKLHISQPAISQHIQNLETRLDVKLLDRTNKYVRLNKAGEIVYHHAKEILGLYGRMERYLQDVILEATGPLHIGASLTFGEYVLPHLIATFRKRYPKISPTILVENTQSIVARVARRELDVGVIEGKYIAQAEVEVEPLIDDMMVVVASSQHLFARKASVMWEELGEENWIVREVGSGTREATDHLFHIHGLLPRSLVEYGTTQLIKESVEAGLGVSLLSKWAVRKELQWKTLVAVPVGDGLITRQFSIVRSQSEFETKAARTFRDFLRDASTQLSNFS